MDTAIREVNIGMIPDYGRPLIVNGDFILADNIHDKEGLLGEMIHIASPEPVRLDFIFNLVCLRGSMQFQMDFQSYELHANQVQLAYNGHVGMLERFSDDLAVFMWGSPNMDYFDLTDKSMSVDMRIHTMSNPVLDISPEDAQICLNLYKMMREKLSDSSFRHKDALIKQCMKLLSVFGRQWGEDAASNRKAKEVESTSQNIFNHFMAELNQHCLTERETAFYADKLCLTPKYMSQVIYQASGHFAHELIREHVIIKAKALLKTRKFTALQVSEIMNFPNPSFFSRYFKNATGMTPREYQNS